MSSMMKYKGYFGSVEYSADDKVFFGKLDGIRALVSFEGTDVETLESSFKEAVEDYLADCMVRKVEPEKPYKGVFNVRTKPHIHRDLVLIAAKRNQKLNTVVEDAFEEYLAAHG